MDIGYYGAGDSGAWQAYEQRVIAPAVIGGPRSVADGDPRCSRVTNGMLILEIDQDYYAWVYRSVEILIDELHFGKDPDSVVSHFELQL